MEPIDLMFTFTITQTSTSFNGWEFRIDCKDITALGNVIDYHMRDARNGYTYEIERATDNVTDLDVSGNRLDTVYRSFLVAHFGNLMEASMFADQRVVQEARRESLEPIVKTFVKAQVGHEFNVGIHRYSDLCLVSMGGEEVCNKIPSKHIPITDHEFEVTEGGTGYACMAMVTEGDGSGTDCGRPPTAHASVRS